MVRFMRGPSSEVDKEGLLLGHGIMLMKPGNCFVGDVRRKVIAILGRFGRLYWRRIAIDARIVLAVGRLIESVEMIEAKSGGPAVKRACRADLPHRRVVPLAIGRGAVAIFLEHFSDRRRALGQHGAVTRIRRRPLGD